MSLFDLIKPSDSTTSSQKFRILVVDDDQYLNEIYTMLLRTEGYDVTSAFNGREALDRIHKNPPHMIILDIMMPIMNGNEVLESLQENDATRRIPVIVLTNAVSLENKAHAQIYNAARFFIKANMENTDLIKAAKEVLKERYG